MRCAILIACLAGAPAFAQESAVTATDRAAAFPDLSDVSMREHMNDDPTNVMVLVDRLEVRDTSIGSTTSWDANMWVGRDFNAFAMHCISSSLKP